MSPGRLERAARRAAFAAVFCLVAGAGSAWAARVSGTVVDRAGKPVEYASVSVPALRQGAVTDEQGRWSLELPPGRVTLEVSQIGYRRARLDLVVREDATPLRLSLADEPVPVAEVTVSASSFGKTGKSEGAVVRRRDVMMTPGGTADIFQALRALPGINAPAEGAAIYVRGGDPHETLIRLDGSEIGHPYHYEGASGGLFSDIDSYMLKSAFFSSGGFSSKYGGVLSGVLDIETQDPMNLKTVSMGANLVGGGLSLSWALVPDRLSLVGSFRMSAPELLFKLYGHVREYESAPRSKDDTGRLLYRYSPSGRISVTHLHADEAVGVFANVLNVQDVYTAKAGNDFLALSLQDVVAGRVALRGQISGQRYRSSESYGVHDARRDEDNQSANVDLTWPLGPRQELSFGAILRRPEVRITGTAPADSTDLLGGAPTRLLATRARPLEPGVYLEDKVRVWGPLYATLGGRFDYTTVPGLWTADPRAALAWRVDEHQTLRVATGRYHQFPDAAFLDPVYGNPRLRPLRADHVIAGYEWKSEFGNIRVEGFRKDYRDLITNEASTFYGNGGFGFARGVDAFVQGTYHALSGWVSYGYLDSKRKQLDDSHEVPSTFGVRHSVTLVGQVQPSSKLIVGARYSHATGRPITPVVGSSYDPARDLWRPVFGDHNSDRLPDYNRLDVRLTRLFSLPAGAGLPASSVCVAYLEAMNVLALRNVLDYVYTSDFSERRASDSYFSRRFLVAGFSVTW